MKKVIDILELVQETSRTRHRLQTLKKKKMCTEKQFIWLTIHTHHEAKPDCGLIHVATFILNAAQTMLACLWS